MAIIMCFQIALANSYTSVNEYNSKVYPLYVSTCDASVTYSGVFGTHYTLRHICPMNDRLCGLVVRVFYYRSGGPGSIPGTTRFSGEKKTENSFGSGTGSTQPREYN
jgi:hypothetical protein